jgi:hypothetical protein
MWRKQPSYKRRDEVYTTRWFQWNIIADDDDESRETNQYRYDHKNDMTESKEDLVASRRQWTGLKAKGNHSDRPSQYIEVSSLSPHYMLLGPAWSRVFRAFNAGARRRQLHEVINDATLAHSRATIQHNLAGKMNILPTTSKGLAVSLGRENLRAPPSIPTATVTIRLRSS